MRGNPARQRLGVAGRGPRFARQNQSHPGHSVFEPGSARRAGVRHLLTEDLQDGFVLLGVAFIDPFNQENDQLIDELLQQS
jgi:hypothetical protein